jgi:thiol-disulfide isomerase/thioredoxin
MMKKFLNVCLALIFVKFTSTAQEIPSWRLNELNQYISDHPNELLVINFWATICKPCVEEIPHFIEVYQRNAKRPIRFIFISLDANDLYPKSLQHFIKKRKWKGEFTWLNETDANVFCPAIDPTWSGSIPATLFIYGSKGIRKFVEAPISEIELEKLVELYAQ